MEKKSLNPTDIRYIERKKKHVRQKKKLIAILLPVSVVLSIAMIILQGASSVVWIYSMLIVLLIFYVGTKDEERLLSIIDNLYLSQDKGGKDG